MNVLIAVPSCSAEMSGVQRHAFNVARSLLRRKEIQAVHLVVAPWQRGIAEDAARDMDGRFMVRAAEMSNSSMGRNAWYYRRLPVLAGKLGASVVHLAYPVPVNRHVFGCPVMVTLHDMYPYEIPENFRFPKVLANRMILRQCLCAVDGIACVSETTRRRMREYLPARLDAKTVCIPNCVAPMSGPMRPMAAGFRNEPFLLCVAQHRRNKNIPLLVRSFARLLRERKVDARMRLLVVGISGPETEWIRREVSEHGLKERVSLLSGLSEAELHWCYARCDAVVAPSSTEGFGLPVAEGMLAGCRVVCSEIGAHREIGAGHCYFVDLHGDAETALATAIALALDTARPEPASLPQLSAGAIGAQYIQLYQKLVETRAVEIPRRFRAVEHEA